MSSPTTINSRTITVFILGAVGLIIAFYAGNWIADENYTPLAIVFGALFAILVFFGFASIGYLLIPICYGLAGQISVLPLPFSVNQLVIMLSSAVFFSDRIFKKRTRKPSREMIDLLAWMNIVYLGSVFLRNPVGVSALGSHLVGGRPYIDFILGVMSYVILSRCVISPKQAQTVFRWSVGLTVGVALICTAIFFVPAIGKVLGKLYSAFSAGSAEDINDVTVGETRLTSLQGGGVAIVLFCLCYADPIKMLDTGYLRYLWGYVLGVIMILLSGFRSAIFETFLITALATALRSRLTGLAKMLGALCFIVALFITLGSFVTYKLPLTAQRALCFLPGEWDQRAVNAADESSRWRFRMWELMMTTDYYIRSKMWGDGYGFTPRELEIMLSMKSGGSGFGGEDAHLEPHLIQGTVHSGPISTIKRVGYVGLGLLMLFMGASALYAYRTLRAAQGTPYQIIASYTALPMIMMPFVFVFIFGDYSEISQLMFQLGMLKMISSSIVLNKKETTENRVLL
jgi:hypothetical protein